MGKSSLFGRGAIMATLAVAAVLPCPVIAEGDGPQVTLEGVDPAVLEALSNLSSGKTITITPDAEAQAAGVKPVTITAADLAKAKEDAARMSKSVEAFANSTAGKTLDAAARPKDEGRTSRSPDKTGSVWSNAEADDGKVIASAATDGVSPGVEDTASATNSLDAVDFSILNWEYGDFRAPTNSTRSATLSDLRMDRDGLRFKYVEDLSSWGLAKDQFEGGPHGGAYACLFVCDSNGRWVGGKFDWISSSRDSRDFENVYGGYGGWNLANIPNPCPAAFVIVSKDGKCRSNVISSMWQR